MTGQWKPGDVAMVTWTALGKTRTERMVRTACRNRTLGVDVWESPDGTWLGDSFAESVRPLIVIDPEDREQVERLSAALMATFKQQETVTDHDVDMENATRAALREFTKRPPAPKCPASIAIGGTVLRCERAPEHTDISGHRNDSIGQGVRWHA